MLFGMNLWLVVIVLAFVVLDFVSGILKGIVTDDISSVKMRQGLLHKATYLLVIILAIALEYTAMLVDLGVDIAGGIYVMTCVWIILTEISSVLENVCIIDPQLKGTKLYALFGKTVEEKEGGKDGENLE